MAGRLVIKPRTVFDTATLGVRRCIIETPDTRERDRPPAHRAGLERDVEICAADTLGALGHAGFTNSEYFRMGRGIVQLPRAVSSASNHLPVEQDRRANRHFAARAGSFGFGEGDIKTGNRNRRI